MNEIEEKYKELKDIKDTIWDLESQINEAFDKKGEIIRELKSKIVETYSDVKFEIELNPDIKHINLDKVYEYIESGYNIETAIVLVAFNTNNGKIKSIKTDL